VQTIFFVCVYHLSLVALEIKIFEKTPEKIIKLMLNFNYGDRKSKFICDYVLINNYRSAFESFPIGI